MSWLSDVRNLLFKLTSPQTFLKDSQSAGTIPGTKLGKDATVFRQIDELIGLIKGVMADGMVHQSEVEFLITWLERNRGTLDQWPANAIFPRLKAALSDGNLSAEEEKEIRELLQLALDEDSARKAQEAGVPYTTPVPKIDFANRTFCFTGKFQSGSRSWCVSQIIARGGMAASKITQNVHYLIVGELNSSDWMQSKHGRKIGKAVKYRESGYRIVILSEKDWFEQLKQPRLQSAN